MQPCAGQRDMSGSEMCNFQVIFSKSKACFSTSAFPTGWDRGAVFGARAAMLGHEKEASRSGGRGTRKKVSGCLTPRSGLLTLNQQPAFLYEMETKFYLNKVTVILGG